MNDNTINLEIDDSRRLTGKSLLNDEPGAILDAFVSGVDKHAVIECWSGFARELLTALGWQHAEIFSRPFEDGVSVGFNAPLDVLYSACEVNDTAWRLASSELTGQASDENFAQAVSRLKQLVAEEANPQLLTLIEAAKTHHAPWLVDEDVFSLGFGASCQQWPVTELPNIKEIHWEQYQSIPTVMITGTNGKSTSVRIVSKMIEASGQVCGVTSTDFIRVGNEIIDNGDYSGPGGARMLLRHPATEVAVLEVARGGLLRRGLSVDTVDAALITNIAEDHLGQYGINTIEGLTAAKAIVAKALNHKLLVLNADDAELVRLAASLEVEICWFSLHRNNVVLQTHIKTGGAVCYLQNGVLMYAENGQTAEIISVDDVPMTLNGAARHNVQNALGAIGLAKSLQIDNQSIAHALRSFSSSVADNPGRGNQFDYAGAKVIVDFAHNVHSMDAMADTVSRLPARQRILMLSMAGDRSNQDIADSVKSALKMQPDIFVVAELEAYLRGRDVGEVSALIRTAALNAGMTSEQVIMTESPLAGARAVLKRLESDDIGLLLALSERDEIIKLLEA